MQEMSLDLISWTLGLVLEGPYLLQSLLAHLLFMASGFELPLNQSHRYIFEASIKEISHSLYSKPIDFKIPHLDFEDIDKVL